MRSKCPKCNNAVNKNGLVAGKQRWKCKSCGFQFTRTIPRGRSAEIKIWAVLLYLNGMSMNSIAKLLKVSTPAVLKWIKKFAQENYEKPEPSKVTVMELDEMWHYTKRKKTNFGYGKLLIELQAGWLTGNVGIVIEKP